MEAIDFRAGFFNLPAFADGDGGGADVFPFGAERFNDRRQNEAFDVAARGEVRAELVPLTFAAEGAFVRLDECTGGQRCIRKLFEGLSLVAAIKSLLASIHGDPALARMKPPLVELASGDLGKLRSGYDRLHG